ncbi:MAG: hypothetical protein ACRDI2_09930 [Chloroflexota bacterium]
MTNVALLDYFTTDSQTWLFLAKPGQPAPLAFRARARPDVAPVSRQDLLR